MPTEVVATPRAEQQMAALDRVHARAFGDLLDDLAAQGCKALSYRLSDSMSVDHMCVKHLRDTFRVVVAFEAPHWAWILLIGRHDDQDPVLNVYAELNCLLGVEPQDGADRASLYAATRTPICRLSSAPRSMSSLSVRRRVRRSRRQPA